MRKQINEKVGEILSTWLGHVIAFILSRLVLLALWGLPKQRKAEMCLTSGMLLSIRTYVFGDPGEGINERDEE